MLVKGSRLCSVKKREPLKDIRQNGDVGSLAATRKVEVEERGKTRSNGSSPYAKTLTFKNNVILLFKKSPEFISL